MNPLLALAVLAALLTAPAAGGQTLSPYGPVVADRFPPPAVRYDTPGLQPGRSEYTQTAELNDALRALAARSGAALIDLGRSGAGAAMLALRFSRGADRPSVLLIGQQHGNEPAGGEALLVIAQRLADAGAPLAAVLERIDVVVLPRANPDGAQLGRRSNAAGLDVNRDHLLLRTQEAQAIAALARWFKPVLVVDAHEHVALGRYLPKFGAVKRHDLLLQPATAPNMPLPLAEAAESWFLQPLRMALDREGLTHDWYHTNPTAPDDLRLSMGGVQPDLARNTGGLRHAVSILLESRGFDLGRLHLERRVHTHVVAIESLLHSAAAHADELLRLREQAGAEVAGRACRGELVLEAALTPQRREVTMLDATTGADKTVTVDWLSAVPWRAVTTRARPCGYWLAADAGQAVERLQALGLRVERLGSASELSVQRYHELARGEGTRQDVLGRVQDPDKLLRVAVTLEPGTLVAEPGSHYVPLDQPLADLAVAALEPDTQNSFFAHRLLPSLASVVRVTAPRR